MNDEQFAREAFAAAFRSGSTGEPPTLPDVEGLAFRGRRAARHRQGAFAAGTTALAGMVTAGVVTGPTLLGIGDSSPSGISVGGPASPAQSSSSSAPDSAKPSLGVPCTTPVTINWLSAVNGALPTGVTATADHAANCIQTPNGSRSYEALFKLSTGTVELQVQVGTGFDVATKLNARANARVDPASTSPSESLDPATVAKLVASKMAAASANTISAAGDKTSSPSDPAAVASLEAQKRALASSAATESSSPGGAAADGVKGVDNETCSIVGPGENACVSHLAKDSLSVVNVQLVRAGSSPLVIDVAATNGKDVSVPASGQLPTDATMLALAKAVAAHF